MIIHDTQSNQRFSTVFDDVRCKKIISTSYILHKHFEPFFWQRESAKRSKKNGQKFIIGNKDRQVKPIRD